MGLLNDDKILVSFRGMIFEQRIVFTHTYRLSGDGPGGQTVNQDLADIITGIRANGNLDLETPYLALLPAAFEIQEVRAQRVFPIRSAYMSEFPINAVGTHVGVVTVGCDSAAITMRGPFANRHNIGTKKIGPVPDGASAAGLIVPAYRALLTTLAIQLGTSGFPVAGWGATTLVPCLINHQTGAEVDIETFRVGTTSRVMSRRVVGRGE